jgi:mannose-6-phosphate isomerase-like protein (cupin superfamily)
MRRTIIGLAHLAHLAHVAHVALMAVVMVAAAGTFGDSKAPEGYIVEHETDIAKSEPGPHKGSGQSIGYNFFNKAPGFKLAFHKRVLHPGASIGYHNQETDEVYYIDGGTGKMTINGNTFDVKPGDAILTRTGSSHGLVQTGNSDLTVIVAYDK